MHNKVKQTGIAILKKQYELVSASRNIVLRFLETEVGEDQHISMPDFNNRSANYLLVHVADCYFHWLSYYALHIPVRELSDMDFKTIPLIQTLFKRVDQTVDVFLEYFRDETDRMINGVHVTCGRVITTPVQVFTHVITHEFHHKGQIMSICRMLGHIPPDTDISNFFTPTNGYIHQ